MVELNDFLLVDTVIADNDVTPPIDFLSGHNWVELIAAFDNDNGVIIDPFLFNPPGSESVATQLRFNDTTIVSTFDGSLGQARVLVPPGTKIEYDNRRVLAGTSVYTAAFMWGLFTPPDIPTQQGPFSVAYTVDGNAAHPLIVNRAEISTIQRLSGDRSKLVMQNGKTHTLADSYTDAWAKFDPVAVIVPAP